MENIASILGQYVTMGTVALGVTVYIITFFVRRIVETALPNLRKLADENEPHPTYATVAARWWQQVGLYAIPVIIGALLGLLHVPFLFDLEVLADGSSRVIFGGVVGWFASFVYKVIRMALKKKTGIDLDPTPSEIPGAPDMPSDAE